MFQSTRAGIVALDVVPVVGELQARALAQRAPVALALADQALAADQRQPFEPAREGAVEERLGLLMLADRCRDVYSSGVVADDVLDQLVGVDAFGVGFEAEDDAMAQRGQGDRRGCLRRRR